MALPPNKFREIVFLFLYSFDLSQASEEEMISLIMQELEVSRKNVKEAYEKFKLVLPLVGEIDQILAKVSTSYDFSRIQTVERNILRLGVYEVLYEKKAPPAVIMSEALRLAKKFATPESAAFVNALLDAAYKQSQGTQVDLDILNKIVHEKSESELETARLAKEVSEMIDKDALINDDTNIDPFHADFNPDRESAE